MIRTLLVAGLMMQAVQPPSGNQPPQVRAGAVVQPETVTVADPFLLTVTVEVPRNARVEWPSIDDTTAKVSQRNPVSVRDEALGELRRETARYTLAAWDTGRVSLGMPAVLVRLDEQELTVPIDESVFVQSVLPGDTTQHVPRPAKDLFPRQVPWWEQWWPALAVLAALALLLWYMRRRRKRVRTSSIETVSIYERALSDFARLDRLALADAGERGRFVALAVEVLRTYLRARVPSALLSYTTIEVIGAVRDDTRVPVTRLAPLLGEADAIKFARYPVDPARARELAAEARAIVDDIERAENERQAALAAARKAQDERDRDDRQAAEDEARRHSRRGAA